MDKDSFVAVLHGSCYIREDGISFFMWSETAGSKGKKKGTIHPFSNSAKNTVELITRSGMIDRRKVTPDKLPAYFPSCATIPLPSEELSGLVDYGKNAENESFSMKQWEVPGISLDIQDAFTMVLGMDRRAGNGEFVVGSDLRFWGSVAAFILNLLSEQKFLPAVAEEGTAIRSKWIPLLETHEDQDLLHDLIRDIPGACLAFNRGEVDPETLVRQFTSSVTDLMCRKFLSALPTRSKINSGGDILKWGASLASGNSLFTYGRSLAVQKISSWTRRILANLEFPMRTCFDLVPPKEDNDNWTLRFMLQSKSDPSLIIPFDSIWDQKDKEAISIIGKFTEFPEEFLLQSLGVAQSIFPPIRKSLQSAHPSGVRLGSNDVYDFLKNYSTVLSESGFGVMFPEWWGKAKKGLGLKVKAKPSHGNGSGKMGLMSLIDYELEIVVDGEPVSVEELQKLAKLKMPIMQIGKKWVEIDRDRLERILDILKRNRTGVTLGNLLTLDADAGAVPILDISGEGWIGDLFNGKTRIRSIGDPTDFKGKLRDYQKNGVSWLSFMADMGFGSCLADDMGLGKTIEIIAFLLERKRVKKGRVALILCPTSVISNWAHEFERFAPSLKVSIHHGPSRKKGDEFISDIVKSDAVLTSYNLMQRDIDFISKIKWDGVIADEAQYVKNYSAKQSRAIRSLSANFKIALTGTPIENRLDDLRSIFDFINPGYLGSEKRFKQVFSSPIEREQDEDAALKLNRIVNPFILRRVKTDKSIISDLPEKDEVKFFIPVTQEQASLYDAAVRAMLEAVEGTDGIRKSGIILSTITKMKRLLDHPSLVSGDSDRRTDRSQKLVRLMDMLGETLEADQRTIIFTQFVEAGKIIKESIMRKFQEEVLFLSGSTPRVMRDQMISRFQDPKGPRVFVISVKAGGFGINLTNATNVIHFDRWWNPAVEDQATDRAYRIGQSKTVHVYKFVSSGTIEEKIDQIIEEKSKLRKKIVGTSDETWLTNLSGSELKSVFSLRGEIMADGGDDE